MSEIRTCLSGVSGAAAALGGRILMAAHVGGRHMTGIRRLVQGRSPASQHFRAVTARHLGGERTVAFRGIAVERLASWPTRAIRSITVR